jgi:hypothetical protein
MDISIVQTSPDDAGEILVLQKITNQSGVKLNDDCTIPPFTETLPEIMSEFETKVYFRLNISCLRIVLACKDLLSCDAPGAPI